MGVKYLVIIRLPKDRRRGSTGKRNGYMIITGKNLKRNVAKGIFSIWAFLSIYRIDLYGLPFADKLRGFVTG